MNEKEWITLGALINIKGRSGKYEQERMNHLWKSHNHQRGQLSVNQKERFTLGNLIITGGGGRESMLKNE